ncbi:acylglycerol kinase family protein [Apilactobacillus xinyiensis]|uniref:DAGKc domain-containing protein n=1 Tax=Apilactobacillus xinyiensis TaxID=2841032 RepID=A0ABT0I1Z4_9LACO|nr:acylglycerol kinase family protein [Apilactobacillus xinyiensis]MCK8624730.1 hypothetical protein [Apilactobacillus xinyiensis]MCL0329913.1 hypothetical protein [Apilactobacillus xinyiensis]
MQPKKYLVVLNEKANRGQSSKDWEEIKLELEKLHLKYTLLSSKYHGHIKTVLSQNLLDMFEQNQIPNCIIVIGGDGTINETINGIKIAQRKNSKIIDIPIGIIPTGCRNEFIKSAKMEINKKNALKKITNCQEKHLKKIGYLHEQKNNENNFFINKAQIGMQDYKNDEKKSKLKNSLKKVFSLVPIMYNLTNFPLILNSNNRIHKFPKVFSIKIINNSNLIKDLEVEIFERKYFIQNILLIILWLFNYKIIGKNYHKYKIVFAHIQIPSLEYGYVDNEKIGTKFYDVSIGSIQYPFIY